MDKLIATRRNVVIPQTPQSWIVGYRSWMGGTLDRIRLSRYELVFVPVYSNDTTVEAATEEDVTILGRAKDWQGVITIVEEFIAWQHHRINHEGAVTP